MQPAVDFVDAASIPSVSFHHRGSLLEVCVTASCLTQLSQRHVRKALVGVPSEQPFTKGWHTCPAICMALAYASKRHAEMLLGPAEAPAWLTCSCCMQEVRSATPSSAYQALLRHEKAIGEACHLCCADLNPVCSFTLLLA